MKTRSMWLSMACLVLVLTASAACGRKTVPLVPDSPRPEAVKDIKAVTRDATAYLSWPIPTRNVEGKNMAPADIQRFRIYRAEFGRDRKRARYKPYGEIALANPAPSTVRNGTVFWNDRNLKYDLGYGYRIRAVSARGGVSKLSDEVRIAPLLSLAIPKNVVAQAGDGAVQLAWEAVATRMDGSRYTGFVGYNVYRGVEKGRYEEAPLNKEPLRTNVYNDTAVENDKIYVYIIRSIDSPTPPWHEGLDSSEASAVPHDLTPPDKPVGLTVVPGIGRVFLTWNENKERDLAGYYVYRSARNGKEYERLTEKVLARTTFSDETAKAGITYSYVITAVDRSGNESERSAEKKGYVELLR